MQALFNIYFFKAVGRKNQKTKNKRIIAVLLHHIGTGLTRTPFLSSTLVN